MLAVLQRAPNATVRSTAARSAGKQACFETCARLYVLLNICKQELNHAADRRTGSRITKKSALR